MSSSFLVSVLITNHNYAPFLAACVESVLRQWYPHLQVVVVDDGSTDESLEILRRYHDRIEVVEQSNQGQWAAFNGGARYCQGDIICLLDADDYWHPDKVTRVVDVLSAKPHVTWLRHKLAVLDSTGAAQVATLPHFRGSHDERLDEAAVAERVFTVITSGLVVRKTLLNAVLGQVPEATRWDADALLLARCVANGEPGYSLDEVLGVYRRHERQQFATRAGVLRMLERQIQVGCQVAAVLRVPAPVSNYKHQLITQSLSGSARFHPRRLRTLGHGLMRAGGLITRPKLCARQVAALLFAAVAPGKWLSNLARRTGYPCA